MSARATSRWRIFTSAHGVGGERIHELAVIEAETPQRALRKARRDHPFAPIVGIGPALPQEEAA